MIGTFGTFPWVSIVKPSFLKRAACSLTTREVSDELPAHIDHPPVGDLLARVVSNRLKGFSGRDGTCSLHIELICELLSKQVRREKVALRDFHDQSFYCSRAG